MKVLMVAEKPSLAIAIAKILSKGSFQTTKGRATPIHEWDGQFRGQRVEFMMTSVLGHVYNLDFPGSVGWQVDPRTLFDAPTQKNEANPNQHVIHHLASVARGCGALILWLDCDREGENIGFEVMEICGPKMNSKHEVYRAKFSAITPQDVNRAMANLGRPNKNESLSVDARREIDLKVGVAFTRYQTTTFHFRYADLDAHLISYGPCQTPTLGFCVDRYDEIQRFRPQSYYKLVAHITRSGIKTKLKWQRGRIMKDRMICLNYQSKISQAGGNWAKVIDVKSSHSKLARPIPLNTVALMKAASTLLGLGPQQCMHIAEHLYINGWISYPRTESSSYPEHFDIHEVIEQHVKHPEWGHVARNLLSTGLQRAKAGVDHGDHPPITPMACAVRDRDLSGAEWRVYEYVACHFIATVCPDAVIENQTIVYEIGGEQFTSNGSSMVEKGFTEVMPWARPSDKYMASVQLEEQFPVESITIKEGVTKPPGFISESELISLMEKHGIGTDASIPTHIENIQRSYVKLHERTRTLEPNKLGIALVHGYHRIDPELVLPKVRANIENLVSQIALGQASYDSVLKTSLETFLNKYDNFVSSIAKIDELFEASFSSLGEVQVNTRLKPKCGKCDRFMKYIDAKPHRLYCTICEEVYSMPKDGSLKSDGNSPLCPLDGFELVVHTDRKGKTTRLCPKCYNTPEYPGMKVNSNCAQCPNKDCAYNVSKFTIEEKCPSCDVGFLALEPANGRRIDCNLCTYHIDLPMDANKITASNAKCDKCKNAPIKLRFKYSEKNNPQPEKSKLEYDACVRCDPVMAPLCKVKIPGVREPRDGKRGGRAPRGGHRESSGGAFASSVNAASSSSTAPLKPASTQAYSLAAVAAIMGNKSTSSKAAVIEEEEDDYETYNSRRIGRRGSRQQQPERPAPPTTTIDLMDMVVVHKTRPNKTASSSPSPKLQTDANGEWESYNPSDLQDVVTLQDIVPPSRVAAGKESLTPSNQFHNTQRQYSTEKNQGQKRGVHQQQREGGPHGNKRTTPGEGQYKTSTPQNYQQSQQNNQVQSHQYQSSQQPQQSKQQIRQQPSGQYQDQVKQQQPQQQQPQQQQKQQQPQQPKQKQADLQSSQSSQPQQHQNRKRADSPQAASSPSAGGWWAPGAAPGNASGSSRQQQNTNQNQSQRQNKRQPKQLSTADGNKPEYIPKNLESPSSSSSHPTENSQKSSQQTPQQQQQPQQRGQHSGKPQARRNGQTAQPQFKPKSG